MDEFKSYMIFITVMIIAVISLTFVGVGLKSCTTNADRVIYKNSITYNERAAQQLAIYYKEYNDSDDSGKESIKTYVQLTYPNLDVDNIEQKQLKQFYIDCFE